MIDLQFEKEHVSEFISKNEIENIWPAAKESYRSLVENTGTGNKFLGWLDLPSKRETAIIERIEIQAEKIRNNSEVFIVVGIGGSYLGSRAVIEALGNTFNHQQEKSRPEILYAGHHISEDYMAGLLDYLDEKEYSFTIISKSGTTTEPAIAFRILKNHIEKKYGKIKARERITAITDISKGALKKIADEENYESFIIPDNIGGRYSVLTPVGLFPIAAAGFNINKLLDGASAMRDYLLSDNSPEYNPAILYASIRNILYNKGKTIEILINYNPRLFYFCEWWKQLFGESEGKKNKGIFPASVNFTTDLHSLGQYIQDGLRNIFETTIFVENSEKTVLIPFSSYDNDGLNYIAGKRLEEVNKKALLGTMMAHVSGQVPNLLIKIPSLNEAILGQMIYFFEFSCALSGYILGVNPFDQPGVEAYKNNMFRLLGKPEY